MHSPCLEEFIMTAPVTATPAGIRSTQASSEVTTEALSGLPAEVKSVNVKLKVHPVILAGGSGSRLWPMSREQHPKQLIGLLGEESLLQSTTHRLDRLEAGY